jgi:LuxR family quorum-sensing system transcriptional regulator CciR
MRRCSNDPHDLHPGEWEGELIARDLIADDPLHHASVWTNAGFQWSELGRLLPLSSRQQRIPRSSGKFDLGEGLTIPANVPGEPSGSCSFAVRRGQRLPEQRLLCAELIGAHAFNAARRVDDHPAARVSHAHLSRRELECLRWVAAGKTDWEIPALLWLSPETAHQYVKHAPAV